MILSWCRRAYSPRVKSPRRTGVAGGVGEGEVVPTGGVLEGEATFFSVDADLKPQAIRLLLQGFSIKWHEELIWDHKHSLLVHCYLFSLSCSYHCLLFFSSSVLFCCLSSSRALRWAISPSLCTSSCNHTTVQYTQPHSRACNKTSATLYCKHSP